MEPGLDAKCLIPSLNVNTLMLFTENNSENKTRNVAWIWVLVYIIETTVHIVSIRIMLCPIHPFDLSPAHYPHLPSILWSATEPNHWEPVVTNSCRRNNEMQSREIDFIQVFLIAMATEVVPDRPRTVQCAPLPFLGTPRVCLKSVSLPLLKTL